MKIVRLSLRRGQEGVSVKILVTILNRYFYCQAIKILYNAGKTEFQEIDMQKLDMDHFEAVLEKIPEEIRIIYYIKLLDKSGKWIADDNEGIFYKFTAVPGGKIVFDFEWENRRLIQCHICGYKCRIEMDECPACNTPLHDTRQSTG